MLAAELIDLALAPELSIADSSNKVRDCHGMTARRTFRGRYRARHWGDGVAITAQPDRTMS